MVCVGFSGNICDGPVPVYLNVYDLTSMNGYAYWVGLGVYHSGVEVHGIEYAFGAHEYPSTGIFEGEPKKCEGFKFRKRMLIGETEMEGGEVRKVMEDLAQVYRGNTYDLITRNCNHFCNDACLLLTGNPIPSWINRLARIGFLFHCVLPATWNSIKVRNHIKLEEKACCAEEKKKLASHSINDQAFSSFWSSSPPYTTHRTSRSRSRTRTRTRARARARIRIRRAITPPSP